MSSRSATLGGDVLEVAGETISLDGRRRMILLGPTERPSVSLPQLFQVLLDLRCRRLSHARGARCTYNSSRKYHSFFVIARFDPAGRDLSLDLSPLPAKYSEGGSSAPSTISCSRGGRKTSFRWRV